MMPARSASGVDVLRVIGTRTVEEHGGYHKDLTRPEVRRHADLQMVLDYD